MKFCIFKNGNNWFEENNCNDLVKFPIASTEPCNVEIKFELPIIDLQGFWIPELRYPSNKIIWNISSKAVGQSNFPYLTFFNSANQNRGSFSLLNCIEDCSFTARMNQEKCVYEITIQVASSGKSFEFLADMRSIDWQESLAYWRQLSAEYFPERNFPNSAWEAVYCTWYVVHAAVTQDWVEKEAKLAANLGFKTLIIDDGWCFDTMKRVSPKTISDWYEWIGDWQVSNKKFPDFINHVKRVQALGMKYMLWVAPFLIGARSDLYQKIKNNVLGEYHEGQYILDANHDLSCEIMADKISGLMRNYPIDGLKIDFLDYMFPDLQTPRGVSCMKFIADLSKAIRQEKNDALIEYRQSYATMQMLPHATQFRAGDVPFDFIDNFHRLCQIRISVGDKVPVHADPMYWNENDSMENIARHMIASLVGVPMLSMELENLNPVAQKVIKTHLALYMKYQKTLNLGKWQIRYTTTNVAYAASDLGDESVIIINDSFYFAEALSSRENQRSLLILNLSDKNLTFDCGTSYLANGEKSSTNVIAAAGHCIV